MQDPGRLSLVESLGPEGPDALKPFPSAFRNINAITNAHLLARLRHAYLEGAYNGT